MEIGERYYAVGPLQSNDGIEKWRYSDDKYDQRREESGNIFKTREDAENFKLYMKSYKRLTV